MLLFNVTCNKLYFVTHLLHATACKSTLVTDVACNKVFLTSHAHTSMLYILPLYAYIIIYIYIYMLLLLHTPLFA